MYIGMFSSDLLLDQPPNSFPLDARRLPHYLVSKAYSSACMVTDTIPLLSYGMRV